MISEDSSQAILYSMAWLVQSGEKARFRNRLSAQDSHNSLGQQSSPGESFRGCSECSDIFLVLWQLLIHFLRTWSESLVRVFFLSWSEGGDMQNQQKFDSMSNMSGETLAPPNEHQSNTHPREQAPTQEYGSCPLLGIDELIGRDR